MRIPGNSISIIIFMPDFDQSEIFVVFMLLPTVFLPSCIIYFNHIITAYI